MSLRRGLVTTAALTVVLLIALAGCSATPAAPSTPAASSSPAVGGAAATSPSPGATTTTPPSHSGSAGPAATPPDFASAPLWVRNREPLPFCGLEEQPAETLDLEARQCFVDAADAGQPAEMIVRATTMEGGLVHYIFRTTPGNPFEQIIDSTGDPFGSGRWERQVCIQMTRGDPVPGDAAGVLNFGFDSCEDATPAL
jgi:hypothetical protein